MILLCSILSWLLCA